MAEFNGQLIGEKVTRTPFYQLNVSEINAPVGTYTFSLGYGGDLTKGFSCFTGTLTGVSVTVKAQNNPDVALVNLTEELYGIGILEFASDQAYVTDVCLPVQRLILEVDITNASNNVNLSFFAPQTK